MNVIYESNTHRIESEGEAVDSLAIRDITKGAFYGRLPMQLKVELETTNDPALKVFEKSLLLRSHVNLDFPELIEGLNYLVSLGKLTAAQADELRKDGADVEAWLGS